MIINPLDYNIKDLNKVELQKGRLLISEPFMDDPNFKRSVVLLTEHNKDGAFGFILNKPLDLKLNEVLIDFPEFDAPVFMGGPVQTDSIFYVHTQGDFIKDSLPIGGDLFWSGNFEQLKDMVQNQQIFPNEIKFFIGYSGWDYDQLNNEIQSESWIISENSIKDIDQLNDDELWYSMLRNLGGKYAMLSNFPENPSLN
jgi:putative transcriptional regulator